MIVLINGLCTWLNNGKLLLMNIDWNGIYIKYIRCCKKGKIKLSDSDIEIQDMTTRDMKIKKKTKKGFEKDSTKLTDTIKSTQVNQIKNVKQVKNYEELLDTIKLDDSDSDLPEDKFIKNLEYNFNVLSELKPNYRLKIDFNEQKISEENGYITFISRKLTGQNKDITLEFIKNMINITKSEPNKYNTILRESIKGLTNLRDTYVGKTWYGEHEIVTYLNKVLGDLD